MSQFSLTLLLPDGVGARNFLLGRFPSVVREAGALSVLHAVPDDFMAEYPTLGEVPQMRLEPYPETGLNQALRHALAYSQMYWADTLAMRYNRRRAQAGSRRRRTGLMLARAVGKRCATPRRMALLDQAHNRLVARSDSVTPYVSLLGELSPSLLLCSHQRPLTILPPVLAAKKLGIPTATCIFSWDNLTTKGRIAAPFDHFLLWSEHMRDEFRGLYPDVSDERIHVVGTLQFESAARHEQVLDRAAFFASIGADPGRPLIVYSGGDVMTCPEDPEHLSVLAEAISDGRIGGQPSLLLRPSPADTLERYARVLDRFPFVIPSPPLWRASTVWSGLHPMAADQSLLINLTHHASLNVNMASTMTLDFAIQDKPVVNIAFDVRKPPALGVPVYDLYYQFDHYKPVVSIGAARIAKSPEQLVSHVNSYLDDPSQDRAARKRLVEFEVTGDLTSMSERLTRTLISLGR